MTKHEADRIVVMPMIRLFSPPRLGMTDADIAAASEDYLDALGRFNAVELETAWRQVRDNHKRPMWPPIGLLVDAATATRQRTRGSSRGAALNARVVDGCLQSWGGACQCRQCRAKAPSGGFYRASAEDHVRDKKELRELDDWMRERVRGAEPKPRRAWEE